MATGNECLVPIHYGRDDNATEDSVYKIFTQLGGILIETFHFLEPINNAVPTRNALGRQQLESPLEISRK